MKHLHLGAVLLCVLFLLTLLVTLWAGYRLENVENALLTVRRTPVGSFRISAIRRAAALWEETLPLLRLYHRSDFLLEITGDFCMLGAETETDNPVLFQAKCDLLLQKLLDLREIAGSAL